MTAEVLFESLNYIDDVWIEEAANISHKRQIITLQRVGLSLCAVVLCMLLVLSFCNPTIKYPTENSVCQSIVSTGSYSIQYLNYKELATNADVIVEADVINTSILPTENDYSIAVAKVKIREVLKGNVNKDDVLCVEDNAKIYNLDTERLSVFTYCGGPIMEKRNRVLLFLSGNNQNVTNESVDWKILPLSIGKFYYDSDGRYHVSYLYSEQSYPDSPYILIDDVPRTYSEIKKLIAGEL